MINICGACSKTRLSKRCKANNSLAIDHPHRTTHNSALLGIAARSYHLMALTCRAQACART